MRNDACDPSRADEQNVALEDAADPSGWQILDEFWVCVLIGRKKASAGRARHTIQGSTSVLFHLTCPNEKDQMKTGLSEFLQQPNVQVVAIALESFWVSKSTRKRMQTSLNSTKQ